MREKEIFGVYTAIGYVNTRDTIVLHQEGPYERNVYDSNNRLSLRMKGKWTYTHNRIAMHSFFLNLDRYIMLYPELLRDTVMKMEAFVERTAGDVKFCTGYLPNENCYRKVVP